MWTGFSAASYSPRTSSPVSNINKRYFYVWFFSLLCFHPFGLQQHFLHIPSELLVTFIFGSYDVTLLNQLRVLIEYLVDIFLPDLLQLLICFVYEPQLAVHPPALFLQLQIYVLPLQFDVGPHWRLDLRLVVEFYHWVKFLRSGRNLVWRFHYL